MLQETWESISIWKIQKTDCVCVKTFPPLRQSNVISFLSDCHLSIPTKCFNVCFLPTGRENECPVLELCNAALSSASLMSVRSYSYCACWSVGNFFFFLHLKLIFSITIVSRDRKSITVDLINENNARLFFITHTFNIIL